MHDRSTSRNAVCCQVLTRTYNTISWFLNKKAMKPNSSTVTFISDGNSVYILVWNLRCTANNTNYDWIVFLINADRIIIRRILYLFVPSFWSQTAVYIARLQGPHAAHRPYSFISSLEESYFDVFELQSGTCLKGLVKKRNLETQSVCLTGLETDVRVTWNFYSLKCIWRNKRLL